MGELTQREKDLQAIEQFRMFDDTFMSAVFDNRIVETELLIRVILNRDDISVIESKSQFFVSNIHGRGLRLDILAKDKAGCTYHFEVERSIARASVKRARFTGAMVDSRLLKRSQDFSELPERYTIFITEEDKYVQGYPVYHAEYTVQELNNQPLGDGSHILYVNGAYRNTETPIGALMHDFSCQNASDIINPILRDRVRALKETERGREEVCQIMESRITEEKIEMAKAEIAYGELTLAQIARTLQLPLEMVQELEKSVKLNAAMV